MTLCATSWQKSQKTLRNISKPKVMRMRNNGQKMALDVGELES